MAKIKIAFLGFGFQASNHHAEYLCKKRTDDVLICGIFDILPEHATICQKKLNQLDLNLSPSLICGPDENSPNNISGVEQLLKSNVRPDAVIISTPHAKHYKQIKMCLEHGIHVLVDKPLAVTFREATELVDIAQKKQLTLVVSSQRRYEPTYQHVKNLIDDGCIGSIVAIDALLSQSHSFQKDSWRAIPELCHGGSAGDHGWHTIDYLCYLVQRQITSVTATLWGPQTSLIETSGMIHIRWQDGISANITVNHLAPKNSVYEGMYIWGTEGIITVNRCKQYKDTLQPVVTLQRSDGGVYLQPDFSCAPAQRWAPTKAFIDHLLTQSGNNEISDTTKIKSWGFDSLGAVKAIEAMYISAKTGECVYLN